ncbi:MAG: uracil-DNA glycosylase [Planctomycetota bacterium]|nr:uracil-DNA glycosylase [Planctomycetota bacterium]
MSGNPSDVRQAVLARLRFEQALGLECLRPRALAPAPAPAAETPQPEEAATRRDPAAGPRGEPPATADLKPGDKAARWKDLEARALACTQCPLHQGRQHVVFGEGNREAKLVFVGEGPGADEDATGRPFVGRAGQLLDKIIGAMGLAREEVYICNVLKCRPPGNRTPNPQEVAACSPYLEEQLELLAPKAIVALGSPAARTLLRTSEGITRLRGRWMLYKGVRVMPTYHPAFVLRQYTKEVRKAVWDDMQLVVKHLAEA